MAFWMNASHSLAALALRRPLVATASASVEHGLHRSQIILHQGSGRVRATEHLPRDPRRLHERRHGLEEVVERGAVDILVERLGVIHPHPEREIMALSEAAARQGYRSAEH